MEVEDGPTCTEPGGYLGERWSVEIQASARKGYAVAGAWPSAIDSESTESLADILVRGTVGTHLAETPLTGKLDAGNPPVQFGGRGGAKAPSLPLST